MTIQCSYKGTLGDVKFKKIKFLQNIKVTSVFFYWRRVKTTPRKGVSKLGVEKIVFNFLCENSLESTSKTIPVGIFADITFLHPFSGV